VGGRHNDAGARCQHLRKLARILSAYTKKSLADPIATAVCLYIQTSLAYDGVMEKCFSGSGKSWKFL